MKKLHILFTLTSIEVLLVIIERLSFTGKILLQPYNFLRLHEVIQMSVLILISVILPFLILKEVSNNFELMKSKKGLWLGLSFIIGVYFYATGNGAHEIASYFFNTFCNPKHFISTPCKSMFFNDYYFGNILYFIGALLMNIPLILFEIMKPRQKLHQKDIILISINAILYAFAIFAYAAFDLVWLGFIWSFVQTISIYCIIFFSKRKYSQLPVTLYLAITFTIATIASLLVRLR